MTHKQSTVRLILADILDQPIPGLKVEIKIADKVLHKGVTSAEGMLEFTAPRGEDLTVQVEHWIRKDMKPVAKFFTGLEDMAIKLISPKIKHTVKTRPQGSKGGYKRGTYKVKPGDTLSKIANAYHVSVDYLVHINGINDKNVISIGQEIKVPPVKKRTTQPQKHAPAPASPPHSADSPETAPTTSRGSAPVPDDSNNPDGNPMTVLPQGQSAVIFPLRVRPLNEPGGEFADYHWEKKNNQACFGHRRHKSKKKGKKKAGGTRKHAARDLYTDDFTEVVAIAAGKVLNINYFYMQTDYVCIHHTTSDGREFVARYGEVDRASILVNNGDEVTQGQVIAKSGILINDKTKKPAEVVGDKNVSMLHFELYTGAAGMDCGNNLLTDTEPYMRREDLIDPLTLLQESYFNTFKDGAPTLSVKAGERIPIDQLQLSELGEAFIKDYEKLRLDYYEDAFGYCTVGWGHLTGGKTSCTSQGIEVGAVISEADAQALFDKDKTKPLRIVGEAIDVPLYQHEFDALCSLAFNVGDIRTVAPSLCRKINAGDYGGAAEEFLDITNGGLSGLVKRRNQENAMFLMANYDSSH